MLQSLTVRFVLFVLLLATNLAALDPARALTSYQRQTWQTESGLPQNTVHAILQTRDGYLWLATEGGLVRFDGLKFTIFDSQITPTLRSNNIRAILEDRQRALWIGTADGLTVFRGRERALYTREQGLPGNSIFSINETRDGSVQVITATGVALYREGRFQAVNSESSAGGVALKDSRGAVWTANRGVTRTFNGKTESFPANDPLSRDVVLSIFEDREGNVWLGTESNGLIVLRDQKILTYATKEGLPNELVRCVYQDRHGAIWIGSNAGLSKMAGGSLSHFTVDDGLSSNVIYALGETSAGDLLAGTQDGLNVIHDGRVTVLTSADGLADDLVRSLHTDGDGAVWIGTRRGLTLWQGSRFRTFTEADGLGSDLVGALMRGKDGSLWVGTLRGLTQFKDGRFKTFGVRDGLTSAVVTAIHEDAAGVLWIGTQDGGLHSLRDSRVAHYSAPGLPVSIYAIVESDGFLWLTSKTGIFRVAKADLSVTQYGTGDGMRVNECSEGGHPSAWRARDGSLWFATLRGVSTIDKRTAGEFGMPPGVAVEKFSVDDRVVELRPNQEIQPGHDSLSFEYTGLSLVSPQRVRFRYRLEGFDRAWVEAGTRRAAYYTSLPPGAYRFRVAARTNDGKWSAMEADLAFSILPHFYQTYWFYALLASALAWFVYAVYRWRVSQVEQRFNAVSAERSRIAREIHDTLAQGFVAVSLQLELLGRKLEDAPDGVKAILKQTRELVQSSLEEARRSIWELRSGGDDFRTRLSSMAAEVGKRAGLKVQFRVLGTYRALPEKVERELLKIGQEAVINVVRHANAKQVRIDLAFETKKVRLTIADDGQGFEGAANSNGPEGHFGLRGMRERAEQIGAKLNVTSQPGAGTTIDVEKIVS